MGHLLANVNPEAAAAIEHPVAPPDVGSVVVYKARAGHLRMGRSEFPGLVLGHQPSGDLILLVTMEPEDMMLEEHVPFQSHNQPHHCWRYRRKTIAEIESDNALLSDVLARVTAIESHLEGEDKVGDDINRLNGQVATLTEVVMGPEVEDLETRVTALEKAAKKGK